MMLVLEPLRSEVDLADTGVTCRGAAGPWAL